MCDFKHSIASSGFKPNRELGSRFIALGVAASALQIFEELDMWDEIVQCYAVMEKEKKVSVFVLERECFTLIFFFFL